MSDSSPSKQPLNRRGLILFILLSTLMVGAFIFAIVTGSTTSSAKSEGNSMAGSAKPMPTTAAPEPSLTPDASATPSASPSARPEPTLDKVGTARMDSLLLYISLRYGLDPMVTEKDITSMLANAAAPSLIAEVKAAYAGIDRTALMKENYVKTAEPSYTLELPRERTPDLPANQVRVYFRYITQEVRNNVAGTTAEKTAYATLEQRGANWFVIAVDPA